MSDCRAADEAATGAERFTERADADVARLGICVLSLL